MVLALSVLQGITKICKSNSVSVNWPVLPDPLHIPVSLGP